MRAFPKLAKGPILWTQRILFVVHTRCPEFWKLLPLPKHFEGGDHQAPQALGGSKSESYTLLRLWPHLKQEENTGGPFCPLDSGAGAKHRMLKWLDETIWEEAP